MKKILSVLILILAVSFVKAQNNSLLWSIVKPGSTDTSYLFGSIHISDARVFNVNKHFNRVFDKSQTVALELHFDSINPFTLLNHVMMEKGLTLQKVMPVEKYALVKSYFEDSLKSPMQFVERFQPIYTSTLIQNQDSEPGKSLDETIFNSAKEQNKHVVGLEKAEEQMNAFSAFPYDVQGEMLYQAVKELMSSAKSENDFEKLIRLYISQDLEGIADYINKFDYDENPIIKPYSKVFQDKLLIERNHRMVERAIPLINKQCTLIVVGAAHLPSEQGLIELFQKEGFDVKPLR
jgi:uncharacterized protein